MENHAHYWNHVDQNFKDLILQKRIDVPLFCGQGWSKRVGSDEHGGYIVEIKDIGHKKVYGLVSAHTEFGPDGWTAGTEYCSLPNGATDPKACKPTEWIVQSGKWRKTGLPKFYFCDKNGKKFNGRKCTYSWSGCFAYSDPNFQIDV